MIVIMVKGYRNMKLMIKSTLKNIAEKMVAPIIKLVNFPMAYLAGRSENMEKAIFRPVIASYSKYSRSNIIQYTTLPKKIETIPAEWSKSDKFVEYAIILQGPVRTDENFTVETVRYYKRCYPGVVVIVSTWKESDIMVKAQVEQLEAVWLESDPPEVCGVGNINMQLNSSLAGMNKAKDLGCKYAMKTRTDQRIYANDVLQYFRNLQETFPSGNSEIVSERLIYISYGSSYRCLAFNLCDFVVFGEINEMIKLYSIPQDKRSNDFFARQEKEIIKFKTAIHDGEMKSIDSPYELDCDYKMKIYQFMIPEVNIVYHYFTDNIGSLNPNDDILDAYYCYLKEYAIVADSEKLMIYWPKYPKYTTQYYNELSFYGRMDFKKWLEIYLHYLPKKDWTVFTNIKKDREESL